jgi:putative thioredoxin
MTENAKKLLADGKPQEALEAFTAVLEKDEANPAAFAGMIRCFIMLNQLDAAKDLADGLEPSLKHPDLDAARAALDVALKSRAAPSAKALERKMNENPDDLQTKFDYAVALFGMNERAKAMDLLLDVIRTDLHWENDKARLQLLDFFKANGQTDPLTVEKRHDLSAILFG